MTLSVPQARYSVGTEHVRFTLFNCITLSIMLLTLAMALRLRGPLTNRALIYWAVVLGYTFGFTYSLNVVWVLVGTAATVALRFESRASGLFYPRVVEAFALCYVFVRCLGLMLLW